MKDDVFVSDNWRNIIWNNRLNEIIDTDELIVFRKVSIGFSIGENQFQACEPGCFIRLKHLVSRY